MSAETKHISLNQEQFSFHKRFTQKVGLVSFGKAVTKALNQINRLECIRQSIIIQQSIFDYPIESFLKLKQIHIFLLLGALSVWFEHHHSWWQYHQSKYARVSNLLLILNSRKYMATKILILCGAYLSLKVKLLIQFERSYYDLRNSLLSDDYTGAEYFLNLREWFRTFHMEKIWQKSTAATAWREWRNFVEKFTRKVWKMQSWVHIEKFSLEKYSFHGQVMLPHHSNQMSERSQVSRIAP